VRAARRCEDSTGIRACLVRRLRGRGGGRRAAVELAADVADEVVDARLVEALLEGRHLVAALGDLLGEFRVGVFLAVVAQARHLHRVARLVLERAAGAVGLVALVAELRIVRRGRSQLVGRRGRGGRRCIRRGRGRRSRVGVLRGLRVVACGGEEEGGEEGECDLMKFHALEEGGSETVRVERAGRV
jgi:hypothetical protein